MENREWRSYGLCDLLLVWLEEDERVEDAPGPASSLQIALVLSACMRFLLWVSVYVLLLSFFLLGCHGC